MRGYRRSDCILDQFEHRWRRRERRASLATRMVSLPPEQLRIAAQPEGFVVELGQNAIRQPGWPSAIEKSGSRCPIPGTECHLSSPTVRALADVSVWRFSGAQDRHAQRMATCRHAR